MDNLNDSQTKGCIVLLLVAFIIITAGLLLGHSEVERLQEKFNSQETANETAPEQAAQQHEGEGISAYAGDTVGNGEYVIPLDVAVNTRYCHLTLSLKDGDAAYHTLTFESCMVVLRLINEDILYLAK